MEDYQDSLTRIHRLVFLQIKEAHKKDNSGIPLDKHSIQVGDQVIIWVFWRQWNKRCREGPFTVVLTTPTALKVQGKTFWYHRNHCTHY